MSTQLLPAGRKVRLVRRACVQGLSHLPAGTILETVDDPEPGRWRGGFCWVVGEAGPAMLFCHEAEEVDGDGEDEP